MKKRFQKWYLALFGCLYIVSSILGVSLVYIIKGKFNFGVLLGAITGALILIIINIILVFLKKIKHSKT